LRLGHPAGRPAAIDGMTTHHRIVLILGDGIGAEVLLPAQQVLEAVGRRHGFSLSYTVRPVVRAVPAGRAP
jgi:tartrate dehydrogenase/decarboxylase / D-malate dehydrogenase